MFILQKPIFRIKDLIVVLSVAGATVIVTLVLWLGWLFVNRKKYISPGKNSGEKETNKAAPRAPQNISKVLRVEGTTNPGTSTNSQRRVKFILDSPLQSGSPPISGETSGGGEMSSGGKTSGDGKHTTTSSSSSSSSKTGGAGMDGGSGSSSKTDGAGMEGSGGSSTEKRNSKGKEKAQDSDYSDSDDSEIAVDSSDVVKLYKVYQK